ncbi:MAG: hypothetical protein NW226_04545 [Microscillaceae bacterium]|nr:hypothetical protein [Microscillaceae bacterium]
MKPIPFSFIEQASEKLSLLPDDELENLVDQFSEQQPYLTAYLIASNEEDMHEDELELLFYLGIQVLFIAYSFVKNIPEITEQTIDEVEMDNDDLITQLSEESDSGFQQLLEDLMDQHPQGDLLQFAFLAVTEEDEEEAELVFEDESRISAFITLKILIDCLDRVTP